MSADEKDITDFENGLNEAIKRAEASFETRQLTLDSINQELEILNQYLKVIVKEIQEMNKGVNITDDNKG